MICWTYTHTHIYIHTHKYTRITISYFKGICMSHHVILISTNFIRLLGSTSSKFQEVRQWFAIWRISQGSGNILVSTSQWLVSAVKIITKCLDLVSIMLVFIKKTTACLSFYLVPNLPTPFPLQQLISYILHKHLPSWFPINATEYLVVSSFNELEKLFWMTPRKVDNNHIQSTTQT